VPPRAQKQARALQLNTHSLLADERLELPRREIVKRDAPPIFVSDQVVGEGKPSHAAG
jgi:hypothetical protein